MMLESPQTGLGLEGASVQQAGVGGGEWQGRLKGRQPSCITPRCPVSDDLKFGRDCQLGQRGVVLQLLFWAGVQNHLSASGWVSSSPVGLTCAAQSCWKSTSW